LGRARLAQRHDAAHVAHLGHDLVGLSLHQAIGVGEREHQGFDIGIEYRGLGFGVAGFLRQALALGMQVELVHLGPHPRRHRRVGLVARAQAGGEEFHGAQQQHRQQLLRAEAQQLAAFLDDANLVAQRHLGAQVAGEHERVARARHQRQGRLAVDRVQLVEQHQRHGTADFEDLQAVVQVESRPVKGRQVRGELARGLEGLGERQGLDPAFTCLGRISRSLGAAVRSAEMLNAGGMAGQFQ
jgi:hypothetical protein